MRRLMLGLLLLAVACAGGDRSLYVGPSDTAARWARAYATIERPTTTTTSTTVAPEPPAEVPEPSPDRANPAPTAASPGLSRSSSFDPTDTPASAPTVGPVSTGTASWYSTAEMGSQTASGEPLDDGAYTTAHRSLPFGTRLNVCHDGCVVVVVSDRGPYSGGRVLDLSRAAFGAIASLDAGVIDVTWSVV